MKKLILSLHVVILALSFSLSGAESPTGGPALNPHIAISELIQSEKTSPTTAVNVEEKYMRLSRIMMAMIRLNISVSDILPRDKGRKIEMLLKNGNREDAAALVSEAIGLLAKGNKNIMMPDLAQYTAQPTASTLDYMKNLDNIFWGTQIFPIQIDNVKEIVRKTLKVKYLKIRLQQKSTSKEGKIFSGNVCLPSQEDCRVKYNLDEIAQIFKANDWSMIPMLSHNSSDSSVTNTAIDNYVDFVDWFVSRYKDDANIRYVELINSPVFEWKGTKEQLLKLSNLVYDRIKSKYPNIMVGTPGFEYMIDAPSEDKSVQEIAFFLNRDNGAKFDFWAFHGYPLTGNNFTGIYPPTKTAINNKYGGIQGIVEIRKKLDANGWQNRMIIDTEHTGTTLPKPMIPPDDDALDAAFTLQELILKRTLKYDGKFVLTGIMPLKLAPRGQREELAWASLNSDGSLTRTVKAVGLLWSQLNDYRYDAHINGELNNENQVWVEKFIAEKSELYIYFKPFHYQNGASIKLDNETLRYRLVLRETPASVILTDLNGKTWVPPGQTVELEAMNLPQFLVVNY